MAKSAVLTKTVAHHSIWTGLTSAVPEHLTTSDKRGLLWHLNIGSLRKDVSALFCDSAGSSKVSAAEIVIVCESRFERWLEIEIGPRLWLVKRGLIVFVPSRLPADF
jgi:hypothetical protein